jgi:hypothetical protein
MYAATTRCVSQHNQRSQIVLSKMMKDQRSSIGHADAPSSSQQKMSLFMLMSSDFLPVWLDVANERRLIMSIDEVYVELAGRKDQLAEWIEARRNCG